MELKGVLKIFQQSGESNKVHHTEFFCDGNSQSYGVMKEVLLEMMQLRGGK